MSCFLFFFWLTDESEENCAMDVEYFTLVDSYILVSIWPLVWLNYLSVFSDVSVSGYLESWPAGDINPFSHRSLCKVFLNVTNFIEKVKDYFLACIYWIYELFVNSA